MMVRGTQYAGQWIKHHAESLQTAMARLESPSRMKGRDLAADLASMEQHVKQLQELIDGLRKANGITNLAN